MNVPFKLREESLDETFLKGAKERGMFQLKGHRSVGGMRASIYNAMPIAGVQALGQPTSWQHYDKSYVGRNYFRVQEAPGNCALPATDITARLRAR